MTKHSLDPQRTKTPTLTSLQTQVSPPEIVVRPCVTQQEINQQEPASVCDAGDAGVKFCRSLLGGGARGGGFQKQSRVPSRNRNYCCSGRFSRELVGANIASGISPSSRVVECVSTSSCSYSTLTCGYLCRLGGLISYISVQFINVLFISFDLRYPVYVSHPNQNDNSSKFMKGLERFNHEKLTKLIFNKSQIQNKLNSFNFI